MRLLHQLTRLYTYNTRLSKGKYRLSMEAIRWFGRDHSDLPAATKDGRRFLADLSTGMQDTLYFIGEYEAPVTKIVEKTIIERDCKVFLDVGANFGWYTTLFAKHMGNTGLVHAFEPVPTIFENLKKNHSLIHDGRERVHLNNLALGDTACELTINLFEGLSTGHASLSTQGREDAIPFKCSVVTLDSYLEENGVGDVDLVKVDIEGAELGFLRGAGKLFEQMTPPVILMEMALNQTKNFGYKPDDLVQYLAERASYRFYKIEEPSGELTEIDGFADNDIGANVICIPQ